MSSSTVAQSTHSTHSSSSHLNQRQEFCVRWNSHLGSIGAAFPQLLAGQRFVDVTLACEGHQLNCHRLVLAACSSYFETILSENPCKHPVIILPADIKFWEIQALVDFMYKGEVNVTLSGLPRLLRCAEQLRIRGLYGADAALNLNQLNTLTQRVAANTQSANSANALTGNINGNNTQQQQQQQQQHQQKITHNNNNGVNHGLPSSANTVNGVNHGGNGDTSPSAGTQLPANGLSLHAQQKQQQQLSTAMVLTPLIAEQYIKKEPLSATSAIMGSSSSSSVLPSQQQQQQQQLLQGLQPILNQQQTIVPNVHFPAAATAAGVSSAPASGSGEDYSADDDSYSGNAAFEPYRMLMSNVTTVYGEAPSLNSNGQSINTPTTTASQAVSAMTLPMTQMAMAAMAMAQQHQQQQQYEPNVEDEHNYVAAQDEDDSMSGGGAGGVGGGGNTSATDSDQLNASSTSPNSTAVEGNNNNSMGSYKRVRRSEACLSQAARCVSKGQTFQTVSNTYNIPVSTIRFYMARKGILPKRKRGRGAANPSGASTSSDRDVGGSKRMTTTSSAVVAGQQRSTPMSNVNVMAAVMTEALAKMKKDGNRNGNGNGNGDTLMSSESEMEVNFQQQQQQQAQQAQVQPQQQQQQIHHQNKLQPLRNHQQQHPHLVAENNTYKSTAMTFKVEAGAATTAATTPII